MATTNIAPQVLALPAPGICDGPPAPGGPSSNAAALGEVHDDHMAPEWPRAQHGARAGTSGTGSTTPETSTTSKTQPRTEMGELIHELARGLRDVPIHRITFPTFSGEDYENPHYFLRKMRVALEKRRIPDDEWAHHALGQIKGSDEAAFAWYKSQEMTWERFEAIFRSRYMNPGRVARLTSKFYGERHTEQEAAVKFLQRKMSMAQWLLPEVPEETVVRVVFELLHHRIRMLLRAERLTTIEDLMLRAQEAEGDLHDVPAARPATVRFTQPAAENSARRTTGESAPPR